jgi:hypothetical protein
VRQVATGINDTEARVVDISLQPFTDCGRYYPCKPDVFVKKYEKVVLK